MTTTKASLILVVSQVQRLSVPHKYTHSAVFYMYTHLAVFYIYTHSAVFYIYLSECTPTNRNNICVLVLCRQTQNPFGIYYNDNTLESCICCSENMII